VHDQDRTLERQSKALEVPLDQLLQAERMGLAVNVDDQELVDLLQQIPRLGDSQRNALKTVLRDMLKLSELESVLKRH